jgi:hypothetical protein
MYRPRRATPPAHIAPHPSCGCGLYAIHPDTHDARKFLGRSGAQVVTGVVAASGRIELHESGLRAERMRPVAILMKQYEGHPTEEEFGVAARYGLELVSAPTPSEFASYVGSLNGLSRATVRRLLVEGLKLVLEPFATALIDGEAIAGSGYSVGTKPHQGIASPAEAEPIAGTWVVPVAGVSYRPDALQSSAFDPGMPVELVPEPANEHDPNAVGVWDAAHDQQVGYVPADSSRQLAHELSAGRITKALSVWQWRSMRTGERSGLQILATQVKEVKLP